MKTLTILTFALLLSSCSGDPAKELCLRQTGEYNLSCWSEQSKEPFWAAVARVGREKERLDYLRKNARSPSNYSFTCMTESGTDFITTSCY